MRSLPLKKWNALCALLEEKEMLDFGCIHYYDTLSLKGILQNNT